MKKYGTLTSYLVLIGAYLLLSLIIPPSQMTLDQHNLSNFEYRIFTFTIMMPIVVIWLTAFYGYDKLQEYSRSVQKAKEGPQFKRIANGCMWLAWGLPIGALLSVALSYLVPNDSAMTSAAAIIHTYIDLFIALVAFTFINKGTNGLIKITKSRPSMVASRAVVLSFILLGVIYCYSVFRHSSVEMAYHLPTLLLIFTVVIPYLYAWFLGLLSVYEITLYKSTAKGVLYKQFLSLLSYGITAVILTSIMIQYFNSTTTSVSDLTLGYVLTFLYLILVIYGAGYALIALGAKKLKRFEEV